ncbi:transcriptional regulator TbsP [Halosegnis sp.]|uniref:transcriptional regulator TbsP n=1 Tax=Halosegnis sp. TaxID=2864959 RepID=UPI0035D5289F
MTFDTNRYESSVGDVLRAGLEAAADELYVVNPDLDTLEQLLDVLDTDPGPTVKLLAAESVLKAMSRDFKLASVAADLRDADRLVLHIYEGTDNTLLVDETSAVAVIAAGGRVAGLVADDEAFVEGAHEAYADAFEGGESFGLRTPGITAVRETLADALGSEVADDFDGVLASMETARGDDDDLDEVTVSLLVAAKNEELLYDISKWGEDVGIASKATFSRTKSELEEAGLLDTEKVPIDVGRPRLRLKLADDRLQDASPAELASVAGSMLARN